MKTGKGALGFIFAVVALIVNATHTRTAHARLSLTHLPQAKLTETASAATTPNAVATTETIAAITGVAAIAPGSPPTERITPRALLEDRKLRRMHKAEISPAMLQVAA